jgi:hypothetical protein
MPTTEMPAATGPVSDCFTVCNGVSQGNPVVLVDAYETALETSAHPAIIKKVRLVRTSTNFPATLRILFNMLPPCSGPKVDRPTSRPD